VALSALLLAAPSCSGDDAAPVVTTTTVDLGPDTGDGTLAIGSEDAAPAVRAAIQLARADIDDSGGVLGEPLAVPANGEADAAIGPTAIDGVLTFVTEPPSATPERDLVVSTMPSAGLRAQATAELVAEGEPGSVAVLGDDAGPFTDALAADGLDLAGAFTTPEEVLDAEPDALVVLTGADTAAQLGVLIDGGFAPTDHPILLVGDRVDEALGFAIGDRPGVLEGVRSVQPGAEVDEGLRSRLLGVDADLDDLTGAPEAYDATVITALAAEAAGTDDPDLVAVEVPDITRGGETCTNFVECRELLADDVDIAYVGLGGSYALDDDGEPTRAVFTIRQYGADNLIDPNRSEYQLAELPDA
jgi:branched-chain amino acid transport system substrate-binding protein